MMMMMMKKSYNNDGYDVDNHDGCGGLDYDVDNDEDYKEDHDTMSNYDICWLRIYFHIN